MGFGSLMRDTINVYDLDGNLVAEKEKASVQQGKKIITFRATYPVQIGFIVERIIPNGLVERYKVIEPNYCQGLTAIAPHYQMDVVNVNAEPNPRAASTVNTISVSGNARYYQNSTDNSVNTINYTTNDYRQVLNQIKSDLLDLGLDDSDLNMSNKVLGKIEEEVQSGNPNKGRINTFIELLPAGVTVLESVTKLIEMCSP
ncbi:MULTISPECIES: hypothetical protein [unclassified Acinetobacter]|uniref:hypothetical protein n=1 Tax=unclassified Acinetobacter TaxID=196816 RepID=UPI0018EA6F11|nr:MULTISPECIES: hypothetical protein [unclassified Acinetobacter]MBJ6351085.1 hypothetical protein [Acinetobacter sp. c1]MBM0956711.1 hypothetical protein [Acinetobacter sp. C13]